MKKNYQQPHCTMVRIDTDHVLQSFSGAVIDPNGKTDRFGSRRRYYEEEWDEEE